MWQTPDQLMLFAAGFGTRMGALTKDQPKPLIKVAGVSLIDHAIALADAAHIVRKVVNLHYRGDQIAAHLAPRKDITLSWERDQILETGGGMRAAAALFTPGPVYTLNTDAIWTGPNPLRELGQQWDASNMSALLLLGAPERLTAHCGPSDFLLAPDGRIERANGRPGLVYLGAQIIDPAGLAAFPQAAFSLNLLWDALIAEGRAYGIVHQGGWCDVGRPENIALAEAMLEQPNV